MSDCPHRRLNPLTGDWVLVSPGRLSRPWGGRQDLPSNIELSRYDPTCYLCPSNERAGGVVNPSYDETFVFTNDFPALTDSVVPTGRIESPLFQRRNVAGTARVVCFSPNHGTTLAQLPESGVAAVVDCWAAQVGELGGRFPWVQVFENKGELMGCSNPHPHGQIWAMSELPTEAVKEDRHQADYAREHGSCLLLDYAREELALSLRVVEANDAWLAVVPYWAVWPFETLLIPLDPVGHLDGLDERQRHGLVQVMRRLLARYDNLFACRLPYSMGWHGRTVHRGPHPHWQLHAHVYPPLLRSAEIRKFMVGFEMLSEPQRDLTPEAAAARLREVSNARDLEP